MLLESNGTKNPSARSVSSRSRIRISHGVLSQVSTAGLSAIGFLVAKNGNQRRKNNLLHQPFCIPQSMEGQVVCSDTFQTWSQGQSL